MTVKGLGPSWCGIKFESLGNHDSLPWMIASKRVLVIGTLGEHKITLKPQLEADHLVHMQQQAVIGRLAR